MNYTYISDPNVEGGTPREPELYNLTSGAGWPYTRNVFTGYRRVTVEGSRYRTQTILFYPPAPAEFCAREVPAGMANAVGTNKDDPANTTAVCGANGNTVYMEGFSASSYDRDGKAVGVWSSMGPVYSSYAGPSLPGSRSYAEPVGSDALFAYTAYAVPGMAVTFSDTETFLRGEGGAITGAFGTGSSAREREGGTEYNTFIYEMEKDDEEAAFLEKVRSAYGEFNIAEDEIPDWVKDGRPMPKCLAVDYGGCPTEEVYCGENGMDPGCTASPYQEPSASMKPGAIAGFCILAIVVVAAICYSFHRRSVAKQRKHLRKEFALQVTKRIDLRGSVSQLNPDDLAAEFKRIDRGTKGGSSDGFISRDELWEFISSGKAGEMSERDFNALFDAMDIKGRGKVNFVEFCAYMSSCSDEIREVAGEGKGEGRMSADERLEAASMKLSQRKLTGTRQDDA
ncbi:hypothetical protein ACHAWF_002750 [Thalassiosira exigua]